MRGWVGELHCTDGASGHHFANIGDGAVFLPCRGELAVEYLLVGDRMAGRGLLERGDHRFMQRVVRPPCGNGHAGLTIGERAPAAVG